MHSRQTKRRYNSARRQQQANETREAILEVARRRFLTDGFAPTTVAAIAADVAVSVDTIYKSFGSKAGLVRAISARALAGEGPVPAETRSDALHTTESDPHAIIRGWGALSAEVAQRIAPILLLVRQAATADPEMADLQVEMDDQRQRMTHNARNLADAGHLRNDVRSRAQPRSCGPTPLRNSASCSSLPAAGRSSDTATSSPTP